MCVWWVSTFYCVEKPPVVMALPAHNLPSSPLPQVTYPFPNVPASFFLLCIVQPLISRPRSDNYYSTKSLLGALAVNGVILAAEIIAFTYMRRHFRLIYEPRSLTVSKGGPLRPHLTVGSTNSRLENDNRHYPLGSGDGRALSFLRTIARLRISTGSTATFSSVSCA